MRGAFCVAEEFIYGRVPALCKQSSQGLTNQAAGVSGLFQSIGMAAHLNEQAAGRKILIVIAVVEQHRPCEAGEHAFHLILPAAGKAGGSV